MTEPPNLQFQDILFETGQKQVVEFIAEFRETHGPQWLAEFREEYPDFCFIIDLVANHDADQALTELCRQWPALTLVKSVYGQTIKNFHGILAAEINKKR